MILSSSFAGIQPDAGRETVSIVLIWSAAAWRRFGTRSHAMD